MDGDSYCVNTYDVRSDISGNTVFGLGQYKLIDGTSVSLADVRFRVSDEVFAPASANNDVTALPAGSVLTTGTGSDILRGGIGSDLLYAGANNDTISGGAGDDLIYGDAGDDRIQSGNGDDRVLGGTGFFTTHLPVKHEAKCATHWQRSAHLMPDGRSLAATKKYSHCEWR